MGSRQKRVAVIGAGVSGVTTAKYLLSSGIDVVVFERSKTAGGNWNYDERKPLEPQYPSIKASIADFIPPSDEESSKVTELHNGVQYQLSKEDELRFAPPGPAYSGLTNNISTKLQELKDFPWPEGTPDYVNVRAKKNYIQSYSKAFGVEESTRYNTRVEKLQKEGRVWKVQSTALIREGNDRGKRIKTTEEFDLVVVASGHYHASKVPDIPGLKEWKQAWSDRVQHSKGYRNPEDFKDQNVLLIGAGVSSFDIARESCHLAKRIYQSSRGGAFDVPSLFLPPNTERVAGIASFDIPSETQTAPGIITLVDGTVLHDIDRVVICTGYLFSLPFLLELHDDLTPREKANDTVLVTDGTQLHNLHKDIFYIPDPTLAFIGVPAYTATFTFFEFQAIAVAAVFSGRAWLPSKDEIRAEYKDKVKLKGFGRSFHSEKDSEVQYVKELLAWINGQAELTGGEKYQGHSEEWLKEEKVKMVKLKAFLDAKTETAGKF